MINNVKEVFIYIPIKRERKTPQKEHSSNDVFSICYLLHSFEVYIA